LNFFHAHVFLPKMPTLHRTWTHIRRLVAGIMLVAFASFVLHGSAMARVTPMHSGTGGAGQHHDHGAHDHGASAAHTHGATDHDHNGAPDAADPLGATDACCGSFCATAITPSQREAVVSRVATSAALRSYEADVHGVPDEGPRKPPRTPDIG
jgi:hypothetical protein